jgi:hypothetical protein
MIGATVIIRFDSKKIRNRAKAGNIQSLGHAAAAIRLTARRSIQKSPNASTPGTPPHTRRGQLKNAILYAVEKDKETAVIGPDVSKVGKSGMAHEFGGRYRKENYPKRSFMGPALEKIRPRLSRMWQASVK